MVGRFIGTFTLRMFKPGKVLALHAVGAVALIALSMATTGPVAMYAILAVGLFNSIMFPTIFTLAIDGLGKHTGQGSGILCMAIVGGALIPVLQGAVADAIGIHHCFIVALLCYVYIAWYGSRQGAARAMVARGQGRRPGTVADPSAGATGAPRIPERAHERRGELAALRADADAELAEASWPSSTSGRAPWRAAGSCRARGAARRRRRSRG